MTKLETPAERYNRIYHLVDSTPHNAPSPITYGDAFFVLDYVGNDATAPQELRNMARHEHAALLKRLRQRQLKEQEMQSNGI